MDVVLISFQANTDCLGVKYLHAHLLSCGFSSQIILIPISNLKNETCALDYIAQLNPKVICFSCMSHEFEAASGFSVKVREKLQHARIVFGGIHPTLVPETVLKFADIVVRGEGEKTLEQIVQKTVQSENSLVLSQIENCAYKEGSEVRYSPVRPAFDRLDDLAFPDHAPKEMKVVHKGKIYSVRNPLIVKRYTRYQGTFLSILSSRGCPFSCSYCCNSALHRLYGSVTVRLRSVDNVIKEIQQACNEHPELLYVNFQDDCFMAHSLEWIKEFSKQYKDHIHIPFIARTSPRHVNEEKIASLYEAGLRWVFMGLESASDRINREIYLRPVTVKEFIHAAGIIAAKKIPAWYDLILDNPFETEQEKKDALEVILNLPRPFELALYSLVVFPGTPLADYYQRAGNNVAGSYTDFFHPRDVIINQLIRMSPVFPPVWIRFLYKYRTSLFGKMCVGISLCMCIFLEAFVYIKLIHRSHDGNMIRTIKTIRAFWRNAFSKLILGNLG